MCKWPIGDQCKARQALKYVFWILLLCLTFFTFISLINPHICLAQAGWPAYTQNVLFDPIVEYIQAATLPGSIMVSGCWGYPWFSVPWDFMLPSNAWSNKNYYMFYPPIGWFDHNIYPFWHVYNVADPLRDFPNFFTLMDNPGTWMELPWDMLFNCTDPICYYLSGGIHFFSGAVMAPYGLLANNNPSIDPMLLRYLSLMGLFDYDIPSRLAFLPGL